MERIDVKCLVHAGASTTRRDDERYRKQAEAYAVVDPARVKVKRAPVSRTPGTSVKDFATVRQENPKANKSQIARVREPESLEYLEDTQLAFSVLRSQLPASSAPVSRRVSLREAGSKRTAVSEPPVSQHSPDTDAASSQISYLQTPIIARASKEAQVRAPPRPPLFNQENIEHRQKPDDWDWDNQFQKSVVQKSISDGNTDITNDTTSELPTSYSLSEATSGSKKGQPRLSERSAGDSGTLFVNQSAPSPSKVAQQIPCTRTEAPDPQRLRVTGHFEPSVDNRPKTQPNAAPSSSEEVVATLQSLSMTIQPPPPSVSVGPFESQVTPTLRHLACESSIANCFQPIATNRAIDPQERGQWTFDCPDWSLRHQVAFWHMLENVIGNGSAGWGVWASRGPDVRCGATVSQDLSVGDAPLFGPVRVFCWGEIVRHVYLLLYVASNSKVRRLGLQWIDSAGSVVIQMLQDERV